MNTSEPSSPTTMLITMASRAMPSSGQNRPLVTPKESNRAMRRSAMVIGMARLSRTASQTHRQMAATVKRATTNHRAGMSPAVATPATAPMTLKMTTDSRMNNRVSTSDTTRTRTSSMPSRI